MSSSRPLFSLLLSLLCITFMCIPIQAQDDDSMPVELQTFEAVAAEKAIQVNWSTGVEENSDRFEVEVSSDLRTWKSVYETPSVGSNSDYQCTIPDDPNWSQKHVYIRLAQYDNDRYRTLFPAFQVETEAIRQIDRKPDNKAYTINGIYLGTFNSITDLPRDHRFLVWNGKTVVPPLNN